MSLPSTSCSLCGYHRVVVRFRPLWLPLLLDDAADVRGNVASLTSHGARGEHDLCADCRNRVLDTLQPVKDTAR